MKICEWCNVNTINPRNAKRFCSKSCATSYRNKRKILDGTHNFYNLDRSENSKILINSGKHPFQNLSKEIRKEIGIKKSKDLIKKKEEGKHPWQGRVSRINNEHSRLKLVWGSKDWLNSNDQFYIAKVVENEIFIKIGVTTSGVYREFNHLYLAIKDINIIREDSANILIDLERDLKLKYSNEESFKVFRSYETFPKYLENEIRQFILSY